FDNDEVDALSGDNDYISVALSDVADNTVVATIAGKQDDSDEVDDGDDSDDHNTSVESSDISFNKIFMPNGITKSPRIGVDNLVKKGFYNRETGEFTVTGRVNPD
ncbi:hypothetical protein AAULH_13581, partial [Lactobacillus helveticus MTCC 5463]